uniref:Uncharacterized protein n=1 Tax=Arundo donax TaxID=35708 RepID=A0A0A8ZWH8_ARUDO
MLAGHQLVPVLEIPSFVS